MAIPTFTSISPATGPTGGRNLVAIVGTNFRLPPLPGTSGPSSRVLIRTVQVTFAGEAAFDVYVISSTLINATVPQYRGDSRASPIPAVGVTLQNQDNSGVAIPGESITAAAAYTYARPPLRVPEATEALQLYQRVAKEVVRVFRRQIHPNAEWAVHTDYGESGVAVPKRAKLPSISITGPRFVEDLDRREQPFPSETIADGFKRYWPTYTVIMEFDAVLASSAKRELMALVQAQNQMFMRTPWIETEKVFGDPSQGRRRFPFEMTVEPTVEIRVPNANVHIATSTFQVRGIAMRLDDPIFEGKKITLVTGQVGGMTTPVEVVTIDNYGPVP